MAISKKITHICENCAKPIGITSLKYINDRQDSEKIPFLRNYSLFSNFCPYCGQKIYPETCLLYQDTLHRFIIYYIDGKNKEAKKQEVLKRIADDAIDGYTYRVVTDRVEFVEKVEMLIAGFDDRIMLLAKWTTYLGAMDAAEDIEPENIWFELDEDDRSVWHIDYPDDYERILEITPEQYAQFVSIFCDIADMSDEKILIDNEWASSIVFAIDEAMKEDEQ